MATFAKLASELAETTGWSPAESEARINSTTDAHFLTELEGTDEQGTVLRVFQLPESEVQV